MNAQGGYYGLVQAQNLRGKKDDKKEVDDVEDDEEEIPSMMNFELGIRYE